MFEVQKAMMKAISSYAGARVDYVQGGGGNTSVKFDERLMAIKASGYTLAEVTEDKGYVTVQYQKIVDYYNTVDISSQKDFEKESLEVSIGGVELLEGMENKRPSVEVGFHSLLKRCVIHTHSVYANVLCCSKEGREQTERIFKGAGINHIFLPYINPGFRLTLDIKRAIGEYEDKNGFVPDAIFLANHGLIVHADDSEAAVALHEDVSKRIISYFSLPGFPSPEVMKSGEGYESGTDLLKTFAKDKGEGFFKELKLYPDQLVYTGGKLGIVINIDSDSGRIFYNAGEKESRTIEETLLGVTYIIEAIKKSGLTLMQMNEENAEFINGWESEKYRSRLIK